MESLLIEVLKLVAVIATACLTSGGLIMYYVKKHDRLEGLEKEFDRIAEGMKLGLENDVVIFNALRLGHINGESEAQEKKLRDYFKACTMKGFDRPKEMDE